MQARSLKLGDEAAVVPSRDAAPIETVEISRVIFVTTVYVQLSDGRMFSTIGGKCLGRDGYIVPATDAHRAAVKRRIR
jgi:hypothetical protein